MMKAASTSETSVNFYQTKRRNSPEDSHLNTLNRPLLLSSKFMVIILLFIRRYLTYAVDRTLLICYD
jgi:hypothetical protein